MTEGLDDDVRYLFDLDVLVEVRDQAASRGVVEFGVTMARAGRDRLVGGDADVVATPQGAVAPTTKPPVVSTPF